jgi:hypothetical protein
MTPSPSDRRFIQELSGDAVYGATIWPKKK